MSARQRTNPSERATVLALCLVLVGCTADKPRAPLSASLGVVTVDGSGALLPLLLEAGNQFMRQHPNTVVLVSSTREAGLIEDVLGRSLSIATSTLPVVDDGEELDARVICDVALAIVANKGDFNERVRSLTRAQLRSVVEGKIANWSDLGGGDQRIVFVDRRSSGDHVALAHWLGLSDFAPPSSEEAMAATVQSELTTRLGALSVVALPYRHPGLRLLALDGVEPNSDSVRNGRYTLRMRGRIVLRKDAPAPVRAFADFLMSPAVQQDIVEQLGYAPAVAAP